MVLKMSIEHLTYDSRMISSTSDKTDLRGCDLMVMSERILQTLLLAPKQRLQAEKSLAIFSSESHLPEVRNHAEALIRLSEEQERLIASISARQAEFKKEADENTRDNLRSYPKLKKRPITQLIPFMTGN